MSTLPPTNLQGDYRDSCVVCLRGTDTALAFTGEAEWATAGLINLGVPNDQALAIVERFHFDVLGAEPGCVLDGRHAVAVRVCAECVSRAPYQGFPSPGVAALGVPNIEQQA